MQPSAAVTAPKENHAADAQLGWQGSTVNSVTAAYPAVDIGFVGVTGYLTVGACCGAASDSHVNDRVTAWSGSGILFTSDASFHPTRLGYDASDAALLANL
ncbi:MAG: hypothetical protein ABIR32_15605 [Ilumatobacteraceae bacterium]